VRVGHVRLDLDDDGAGEGRARVGGRVGVVALVEEGAQAGEAGGARRLERVLGGIEGGSVRRKDGEAADVESCAREENELVCAAVEMGEEDGGEGGEKELSVDRPDSTSAGGRGGRETHSDRKTRCRCLS